MADVLIPTKGRNKSLLDCIDSIGFHNIYVVGTCAEDVAGAVGVINIFPEMSIIEAQNYMASISCWDVLPISDDVYFYDEAINIAEKELKERFYGNGVIGFNVVNMDHSPYGFCLVGRKFIEQRGFLFYKGYRHFYADTELGEYAEGLGRFYFCKEARMEHYHPVVTRTQDKTHTEGRNEKWIHDNELYESRRK